VISSATEAPSFAWLRPEGKPRNRIALRYSGGGAFGTQIVFAAQPTLVAFASVGISAAGTRADGVRGRADESDRRSEWHPH
jgi:hypothetical protein